jgi:lipopolysaccharide biosynthesis glycosyltransferase
LDFDELSKDMNVDTNFNRSAYGRLFLAQVENVDLMLYFDSDTIVAGSVLDLLDADMTGKPLAGVQDTVNPYFVHKVGMTDEDRYINSGGVLIFNLKLWREQGLEKKFVDYILSFNGNPPLDDQGTLNHVCKGSIKILPPEYNLMNPMFMYSVKRIKRLFGMKTYYTQEEIDEAKKHPKVIHYTAEFYNRPWFANCTHPMKQMYLDYLAKSPWSGNKPVFKELSKNCRIQNWVFEHCPFFVYICMIRFIQVRHILRG